MYLCLPIWWHLNEHTLHATITNIESNFDLMHNTSADILSILAHIANIACLNKAVRNFILSEWQKGMLFTGWRIPWSCLFYVWKGFPVWENITILKWNKEQSRQGMSVLGLLLLVLVLGFWELHLGVEHKGQVDESRFIEATNKELRGPLDTLDLDACWTTRALKYILFLSDLEIKSMLTVTWFGYWSFTA